MIMVLVESRTNSTKILTNEYCERGRNMTSRMFSSDARRNLLTIVCVGSTSHVNK